MEAHEDISEVYFDVRNILDSIGINENLINEILSYRLLVERLGERDNNDWWKSNLFTRFGRDSLEEVVPKSWTKARIKLAREVSLKVEKENVDESDFISLFYLGPYFEHKLEKELDSIDQDDDFEPLEKFAIKLEDTDWNKRIVKKDINFDETEREKICLGDVSKDDLEDDENIEYLAKNLFKAYGMSTKNELKIPYYVIKDE